MKSLGWLPVGLAAVGAIVAVACTSEPSCTPGALTLHVGLLNDALSADTITITSDDVGSDVMQTLAHTPNDAPENVEHFTVDVAWPNGYPGEGLVHFTVRALTAGALVAESQFMVRLGPKCSEAEVLLFTLPFKTVDLGGGATD